MHSSAPSHPSEDYLGGISKILKLFWQMAISGNLAHLHYKAALKGLLKSPDFTYLIW